MFEKVKIVDDTFLKQLESKTDEEFVKTFVVHLDSVATHAEQIKEDDCTIFQETVPHVGPYVTTIVIVLNDYHMCHILKYYEHTFEKITITIPEIHALARLLKKDGD